MEQTKELGPSHTTPLTLWRLPTVKAETGLSSTTIYRFMADKKTGFPAPVKVGERASAWLAEEVRSWVASRVAASRGQPSRKPVAA